MDSELLLGTHTLTARAGETRTDVFKAPRRRLHGTSEGVADRPALEFADRRLLDVPTRHRWPGMVG